MNLLYLLILLNYVRFSVKLIINLSNKHLHEISRLCERACVYGVSVNPKDYNTDHLKINKYTVSVIDLTVVKSDFQFWISFSVALEKK